MPSERVEYKNSRELTIVGDFYSAPSSSVIVMSHGLGGSRSEDGRFDRAAEAFQAAGYNVLKFDFSGHGESPLENPDTPVDPNDERDDLLSTIDFVKQKGLDKIGLLGFSFGGYISCRVYNPDTIQALVLWAPVTNHASSPEQYYFTNDGRNNPNNRKMLADSAYGVRKNSKRPNGSLIGNSVFDEWKNIDQENLLSKIKCQTPIIHGTEDTRIPPEDSRTAINYLPKGSVLKTEEASHTLQENIDDVINITTDWFRHHLKP